MHPCFFKIRLEQFLHFQDTGIDPWLLDTQYRMHPSIAELPNILFYDGRINTGIPASDRPTPKGWAVSLAHTKKAV